MSLFNILVDVAARTAGFESGMKRVESQLAHFGEITKKTLEFAGVAVGLNELKNSIVEVVKRGADFDSLAQRMHTTTENLSQLEFIAKSSGVQFETFAGSIDTMSKNIALAAEKTGKARRAFQDLKIDAAALLQLPMEQQLDIIADKIAGLGTAAEQTAATMQIFGDLSALPALQKGAAGIRKFREESDELGNTLRGEVAKALHETEESVNKLSSAWTGLKTTIVGASAPALTATFNFTRQLLGGTTELEKIQKSIKDINYALYNAPSGSGIAKDAIKNSAELNRELESLYKKQTAFTAKPVLTSDSIISPAAREAAMENLKTIEAIQKAQFGVNLDAISRQLERTTAVHANAQSQVKRLLDAGLISEKDYYDAKRSLIDDDINAQIDALNKETELIKTQQALEKKRLTEKIDLTPDERAAAERDFQVAQIQNQDKIADNESKIQLLKSKGREQNNALTDEQVKANRAIANSYIEARAAQQDFFDGQANQQNLTLAGFGKGDAQRQFEEGRNNLMRRFEQQRKSLQLEKETNLQFGKEQYDAQLAILDQYESKGLKSYDQYYSDLKDKQDSFYLGAKSAVADYADAAKNNFELMRQAVTNVFQDLEDAIAQFVITGKFSIKDFAATVLAEFARIEARKLTGSLASGFLDLFGGGKAASANAFGNGLLGALHFGGGKAGGGPLEQGKWYMSGEKGPEPIWGGGAGAFAMGYGRGGGGGATNVNVTTHIDARGATTDFVKEMPRILKAHGESVKADIITGIRKGKYSISP